MKLWPIALVGLVFAAGCGKGSGDAADEAEPKVTVTVEAVQAQTRNIRDLLEVPGSLVVSQGGSAKLSPQAPGRLTHVYAREGDRVHKGQLLATVDTKVQTSQAASASAASEAAQAQAAQSELAYAAAEADQEANVRNAKIALDSAKLDRQNAVTQAEIAYSGARADLAKTRAGARPQEIAQAEQAEVQAHVARDKAQSDLDRSKRLAAEGFVSQKDLEAAQAALQTADSALKSAQASLSLTKAGARPEDLRSAELRAAAARDALSSARSLADKKVAQAELALHQAKQARLNVSAKRLDVVANQKVASQKQADLAAASATADLGRIVAPYDGTVVRRALGPGDFADTTTPVLEIIESGAHKDFLGSLPAAQTSQIRVGMSAFVGSSPGRVVSISPVDPTTGLSNVRIAGAFTGAAGTFLSAELVLRTDDRVVAVPKQAVVDRDGKPVVFAVQGDKAKMVPVTTGPVDGDYIEIRSGVRTGESLVKVGQYELADGASIKLAAAEKSD